MKYTVADTMEVVRDAVPTGLVDAEAWRAVRTLGGHLPAALPQAFYLECRLRAEPAPVDWIVRVEEAGREILAGRNPRIRLPEPLASSPVWARIARFCAAWTDEPGLRRAVANLWLEFDLAPGGPAVAEPSVFVSTDERVVRSFTAGEWEGFVGRLMALLGPGSADTRRTLQRAIAERPAGARIPYLGFMLGRAVQPVRLYLAGVGAGALPSVLGRAGWRGAAHELEELLARVAAAGEAPEVGMAHLDLDGEVLPRVGVEYTLRRPEQLRGTVVETGFLDHLVALGLCAPQRRAGLTQWSGHTVATLRHELWQSVMLRRLNCIKLVHEPGRVPEAKGYLLAEWRQAVRRKTGMAQPSMTHASPHAT
jgi:hypothetical protein